MAALKQYIPCFVCSSFSRYIYFLAVCRRSTKKKSLFFVFGQLNILMRFSRYSLSGILYPTETVTQMFKLFYPVYLSIA